MLNRQSHNDTALNVKRQSKQRPTSGNFLLLFSHIISSYTRVFSQDEVAAKVKVPAGRFSMR